MTSIECQACGSRLRLPEDFAEGARFVCARCGQISANTEIVRNFRRSELDAYTQRWGASRTNIVTGLAGASVWLPLLAAFLAARHTFDVSLLAALAFPYSGVLAALFFLRAGRPMVLYMALTWILLGLYLAYMRLLFEWRPRWGEWVIGPGSHAVSRQQLLAASFFCAFSGAAVYLLYRLQARRLPKLGS